MQSTKSEKIKVVVAGTGNLGRKILYQLSLMNNVEAVGISRDLSKVPKMNNVTFVQGDITKLDDNLRKALRGAKTVISAVQGGRDVLVDGQTNLLRAAEEANVTKFIPSTFSFNLFNIGPKEHVYMIPRLEFASILEKGKVPQFQHVLNGCFMDVIFGYWGIYNPKDDTISYYGSDEQLMDFTSYDDTAKYTARLATDFSIPNGTFQVVGEELNLKQLVSVFEKVNNKKLKVIRKGGIDDLKKLINELKEKNPSDMNSFAPYMYQLVMFDGRGKLNPQNKTYPQIKPQSLEQFLTLNSAVKCS